MGKERRILVLNFCHLIFEFVSSFEIRISCFEFQIKDWVKYLEPDNYKEIKMPQGVFAITEQRIFFEKHHLFVL